MSKILTVKHSIRRFATSAAGVALLIPGLASSSWAQVETPDSPVVFRVDVVSRTVKAINYHHRQGSTTVALEGTNLAPKAKGDVRVDSKTGATKIDANVEKMPPATSIGEGYLTYVLWAITPEGRAENLGEVMLDDDHARLQAATELQTFGLIVTAEPYYAVTQPSDYVVMEGVVKSGATTGTIMPIEAKYELVARGGYLQQLPPADRIRLREAKHNIPLDLMEARQAMAVARAAGAERHAADTLSKASVDMQNAENIFRANGDRKRIQTLARHVTQLSEDARLISVRRNQEEALAAERAASERRATELERSAASEASARRKAEADAERKRAEAVLAQTQAEEARRRTLQVENQAAQALAAKDRALAEEAERVQLAKAREMQLAAEIERARANAEAAREQNEARMRQIEAEAARQREEAATRQRALEAETERARQAADQAIAERQRMRADLVRQLNLVLATRESARGLIVNMSDVLFDIGRYTLKPGAREKLARVAGILLTHPGLKLEVEGHTDSTGGQALNQRLSEQRADAVRSFLTSQGVDPQSIVARGFGPDRPVADNNTAAGRQANRRVEIVVTGDLVTPSGS